MKRLIFLLITLFILQSALSQRIIKGKVISPTDSLPLPGVTVMIKGTKIGTSTTVDGTFVLTLSDSLERTISPIILEINAVGYTTTEIQMGNVSQEALSIMLKEANSSLNEVVVIGYGSIMPKPGKEREYVSFPWPPPDFSTRSLLNRSLFADARKLRDIDAILVRALDKLGYSEKAYYYIPNGFALVTRIEQIKENGESLPPPDRWSVKTSSMKKISWSSYLRSLFFSTPGYFRIIVFTVTNNPFRSSGKRVKKETAISWLNQGMNVLPEEIGNKNFGNGYNCSALIYEFKKPESNEAFLLNPSPITADDHLQKAKISDALKRK